jgi:hypothetical protein
LFDAGRDGGLDDVDPAGAPGEAQGLGDRKEVFEVKELHASIIADRDGY